MKKRTKAKPKSPAPIDPAVVDANLGEAFRLAQFMFAAIGTMTETRQQVAAAEAGACRPNVSASAAEDLENKIRIARDHLSRIAEQINDLLADVEG